jgi:quercetin 2,3-dioxygenase
MGMEDKKIHRRSFLSRATLAIGAALLHPLAAKGLAKTNSDSDSDNMEDQSIDPVLNVKPMGFQWETMDPFLFCVHHEDFFPRGNSAMGPEPAHFKGRQMGDDFIIKDGFRMYHGRNVPGFPGHPHRGFETVTVVRKGMVDHADSIGAAGRYGDGDVQWMTAGRGVQHSEMFPLIKQDKENPLELFQIWLNLPARKKMAAPHFTMFWSENIPVLTQKDASGKAVKVELIAGGADGLKPPVPPPDSWAHDPANEVCIWNIKMDANASWNLPPASPGLNRVIYFYQGGSLNLGTTVLNAYQQAQVMSHIPITLKAGADGAGILMLQGRPIREQVIQYGPFVMNTKQEINQAFEDYHRTKFGGWPWERYDMVHPRSKGRFARHADGREEYPLS